MDRLKTQAGKLWQLISNPSTAATYQQTLGTTWAIIKETGLVLWLVVCLVLVLGDWFWKASYATGQKTRTWIETMQTSAQDPAEAGSSDLLGKTGQSLLTVGQTSLAAALAAAKGQLGIDTETPASQPIALISPAPEEVAPAPTVPVASPAPEISSDDIL
ncbi:hypothetical protein JOY44_14565 [Phormidium sp. CLA17]|uniref:hypothetical protein n=1 Tax=Leptolyngbya sp. Cla-17 TaxID=2803751 RepID=UPI00149118FF|nr:hypothetical protein [Leptolyngbya sp. Cla-17]MBM0742816.1 hypothetical protein [Leptolyngbya sp. Cla-17]